MKTKPKSTSGIAIYLRVSSDDKQNPASSFDYQRQRIMSAIERSAPDLPIIAEFEDILSGTNSRRPGYQQMLRAARNREFSHIAVYSIDRIGRSSDETLAVARELIQAGIEIIIADAPNMQVDTPSGALFLGIRAVIAQYEVQLMSQRVRDTKRSILLAGGWPSLPPDGYLRVRGAASHAIRQRSHLELDPDRTATLQEAWDILLTTEDVTLLKVCEELHARGHLRRSGKPWAWTDPETGRRKHAITTLHHIFHLPFYAGWVVSDVYEIRRGEVRGHWEPLISDEVFDQGVAILRENDQNKTRIRRHPYLLSGILYMQFDEEPSA